MDQQDDQEMVSGDADEQAPTAPEAAASDVRERIIRRFRAWLDEVLADEEPPEGLSAEILAALQADEGPVRREAAEPAGNLSSLWSAMIALTQETRLQGRGLKQLHETLSPLEELPESVRQVVVAHEEALEAVREAERNVREVGQRQLRQAAEEARLETESRLLDVLLDVRDRLVRGAESAREQLDLARAEQPTWLGRLFGRGSGAGAAAAGTRALLEGCTLSLDRLEEALGAMGVCEITCLGRAFDPERMMAVAVEQTTDAPDGAVLEVHRAGYERHGRAHRLAEVKVARRPAGAGPAAEEEEGSEHHE